MGFSNRDVMSPRSGWASKLLRLSVATGLSAVAVTIVLDTAAGATKTKISKPGAPLSVTATSGNATETISWSPSSSDGGSAISGYIVKAKPQLKSCSTAGTTSCVLTGLTNGVLYTATVQALNAKGKSPASAAIQFKPGLPGQPGAVTGAAGDTSVNVSWIAPSDNGSTVTLYTVTASDAIHVCAAIATSCTVTGLTDGTSYTFTVTATNGIGTGPVSAPSNPVVPSVPLPPVPVIGGVSPATGSNVGGDTVTITGSGFTAASSITFGGTGASYTVNSDTSITATSPAHAVGLVDVQVVTPGGTSVSTSADRYTYVSGADLAISVSEPSTVFVGTQFTETYQVTNVGGSAAAAPTLSVLTHDYASSASSSSMTCTDTSIGHSGRGGGYTHSGFACSMPGGQTLVAGASLTIVASRVASFVTSTQTLKVTTASAQQNNVSHTLIDVISPVLPAAPSAPTGVSVSQDVGSLVVAFTPGSSTEGVPIDSTVVATPTGGGTPLTGSDVTNSSGPATITLPGLVGGTDYSVTVASADAGGSASAPSVDFTTAVAVQPPGAPTITRAAWNTSTEIVTAWTPGMPGDSITTDYQVVATAVDSTLLPVAVDAGTGLVAGVTLPDSTPDWSIQVRAQNAAGWGPWSSPVVVGGL